MEYLLTEGAMPEICAGLQSNKGLEIAVSPREQRRHSILINWAMFVNMLLGSLIVVYVEV